MLRKWYSNLTLRSKVTGFTAAITALALGVVATMSIWQIHRQIDAEQHRAAGTVAMSIARASQLALTVGDAKELSRLANSYLHDQDILFVAIYGQHPTALATAVVDQRAWDEWLERTRAHGRSLGINSEEDVDRILGEYRTEGLG